MKNKVLIDKIQPFLFEIYNEIVINQNRRISVRKIIMKHKMSDSARVALYNSNILKGNNKKKGREYNWTGPMPDVNLCNVFLSEMRKINKIQSDKRKNSAVNKQLTDHEIADRGMNIRLKSEKNEQDCPVLKVILTAGVFFIIKKLLFKKC